MSDTNQVEHEQISTSLEVEKLDKNLFRSKSLWLPLRARGAFGGQVISQALVAATNCVDPTFALHSMHCYFLLSASPSTPIIYSVDRVRDGKSYVTRAVKALQDGRVIFIMLCSFQLPESWQPQHQWPIPKVPSPEECDLQEVRYAKMLERPDLNPKVRDFFEAVIAERAKSPIAIKVAMDGELSPEGVERYMYWMKARSIPKYDAPFQKCILAYASDLQFIGVASRTLGLKRGAQGEKSLGMMSTVDHTLWFYDNDFDFGEWHLYVIECSRAGSGRGIVQGRIYTEKGTLVAVAAQEGVVRANVRRPPTTANVGEVAKL